MVRSSSARHLAYALAALSFASFGCSPPSPATAAPIAEAAEAAMTASEAAVASSQPTTASQPTATSQPSTMPRTPHDPTARAAEAHARLQASEAGQLVLAAIEAHGGLAHYFAQGDLQFRFRYAPVEGRAATDTVQRIDTWSARATHHLTDTPEVRFGWTGELAWVLPPGTELPVNARFWALTPYYFVGVPFVFADPGITLALASEETFEDRVYDRVRVTYGQGVGDAPDDYYIVLIDRETRRVGGVRYIVTYPGFFPDGGHSPEKLMVYDGAQVVDGITFPETFRTFTLDEAGAPSTLVTHSTMADVAFVPHDPGAYAVPEQALTYSGFVPAP